MLFGTNGLVALLTLLTSFKFITCLLIPDTEVCSTINNTEHCFITSGGKNNELRNWQDARIMCSSHESGLYSIPALDNDDIRTAMERYMVQQELYLESTWTAGKVELLSNWTWLNGSLYIGFNPLPLNVEQCCAAKLNVGNGTISFSNVAVDAQAKLICQFTGSTCDLYRGPPADRLPPPIVFPSPTDNSSCYVVFPRHTDYDKSTQKWYTARNICLQKKGDLADYNITLVGTKLSNFLDNKADYYIGLRQHRLVWAPSNGNVRDIKETFFGGNAPGFLVDACISVRLAGQWVWETRRCQTDTLQVVCHKATPATSSSSTSQRKSDDEKVPHITYGGMIGVAVGACIFFVLAIVAAVLITYFIIKRNPCGPHEDDIYADNVHNGKHHCNDEEDKEDYVNAGQMQDDNPDGRNPYADGGPSRAW